MWSFPRAVATEDCQFQEFGRDRRVRVVCNQQSFGVLLSAPPRYCRSSQAMDHLSGGEELAVNEVVECEVELPPGAGEWAAFAEIVRHEWIEKSEARG